LAAQQSVTRPRALIGMNLVTPRMAAKVAFAKKTPIFFLFYVYGFAHRYEKKK
jgi:hypothetical protein